MTRNALGVAITLATMITPCPFASADALDVDLQFRAGVTSAPFITMELPHVDGYGAVLVLAARVRVRPSLHIEARVPLALVNVEQPAGSFVGEAAWGNPELALARDFSFQRGSRTLLARARLAVGAPLAEHGSAGLMENRALAIADALFAWRERELFVPTVLPITPAGELALPFDRWSAHAAIKMPLLVAGDANPVALTPVLGVRARAAITGSLDIAAGANVAFELVRPIEWIDEHSRIQTSADLDLTWQMTTNFRLGAMFSLPLGGALGGETFAGGLYVTMRRATSS